MICRSGTTQSIKCEFAICTLSENPELFCTLIHSMLPVTLVLNLLSQEYTWTLSQLYIKLDLDLERLYTYALYAYYTLRFSSSLKSTRSHAFWNRKTTCSLQIQREFATKMSKEFFSAKRAEVLLGHCILAEAVCRYTCTKHVRATITRHIYVIACILENPLISTYLTILHTYICIGTR